MNCKNCGNPLVPEDKFCKLCGTPVQKNNNNVGMPANPQGPAPMPKPAPNQPMNPTPTPVKANNNPPTPVKVNGPVGPGPVKPMNQPAANLGPKPNHGMNLSETQTLGSVPGAKPKGEMPGNKPGDILGNKQSVMPGNKPNELLGNKPGTMSNNKPNGMTKPMPMPPKPVAPAPVPGMPMNTAPVEPEPESKGGAMKVVLIVLLIIGLAVGGYFGYKALSKDDGPSDGGGSNPTAASSKKVDYGGYTFDIPTKFMVKTEEGMLNVEEESYGFYMTLIDYSYSQVSPTKVVSNYTNQGFTAEYKGEKEYNGTKYHFFSVQQGGESVYIVYVPLGASKLLALTIYNNPASVLPSQSNVDEALAIGLSGTYTGTHNVEKAGIEKMNPKNFLVEGEAKNTGDVLEYEEEYSYADVTVDELY